jgi:hypothetical protein
VRAGDLIVSEHENKSYVIEQVVDDHTLVLKSPFAGQTTGEALTGGVALDEGYEMYTILSQDVLIAGGEVTYEPTEVFRFNPSGQWPTADPGDYVFVAGQPLDPPDDATGGLGRYGHDLVSLGDLRLLVIGGRDRTSGEHTSLNGTPTTFADDPWSAVALDPAVPLEFPRAFRVPNGMVIVVHQYSAQAYLRQ